MKPRSNRPALAATGLVSVVALASALPACGGKDDSEAPPAYDACPSGMIEISEHKSSDADASLAPPGVYDLTVKDSVQGGVNAVILREVTGGWATEWSFLEQLSLTEYRVRIQTPRIGAYRVDAYGLFAVDGRTCLASEHRQFLIADSPAADASVNAPPSSDAGADGGELGTDAEGADAGESGTD